MYDEACVCNSAPSSRIERGETVSLGTCAAISRTVVRGVARLDASSQRVRGKDLGRRGIFFSREPKSDGFSPRRFDPSNAPPTGELARGRSARAQTSSRDARASELGSRAPDMFKKLSRRNKESYKFRCASNPSSALPPPPLPRARRVGKVHVPSPGSVASSRRATANARLTAPSPRALATRRIDVRVVEITGIPAKVRRAALTLVRRRESRAAPPTPVASPVSVPSGCHVAVGQPRPDPRLNLHA